MAKTQQTSTDVVSTVASVVTIGAVAAFGVNQACQARTNWHLGTSAKLVALEATKEIATLEKAAKKLKEEAKA